MQNNFIDELARNALEGYDVPFEPDDWLLMEQRIAEEKVLRRRLIAIKGIEVVLMLLAIWTISHIPLSELTNSPTPSETVIEQPLVTPSNDIEQSQPIEEEIEQEPNPEKKNAVVNMPMANISTSSETNQRKVKASNIIQNQNSNAYDVNYTRTTSEENTSVFNSTQITNAANATTKVTNAISTEALEADKSIGTATTTTMVIPRDITDVAYLSVLPTEKLTRPIFIQLGEENPMTAKAEVHLNKSTENELIEPIPNHGFKSKLRLNAVASTDVNKIDVVENGPYKQAQFFDYSAGVGVNWSFAEKWELNSSLILSNKRYMSRALLESNNNKNSVQSTSDVSLYIAELPINLQYNLKKTIDWRIYALTGISSHMIVAANYTNGRYQFSNTDATAFTLLEAVSDRQDKGVFNGGNLKENMYFTANVGFGVERQFNKRWSLFMQPNYKLSLSPVGHDKDRISTFSFTTGVMFTL